MSFNHLTSEDRNRIESLLTQGYSFKEIGEILCKSPTTVSREVAKHRYFVQRKLSLFPNNCVNRAFCQKDKHCKKKCLLGHCHKCHSCYKYCGDYVPYLCQNLTKRGRLVCNGCHKDATCRNDRYYYSGTKAQSEYSFTLKDSREGINMTKEEFGELDRLVSGMTKKGQSIAHIVANNRSSIRLSERSIYKYFEQGLFNAKSIDLPRKVRYKLRKKHVEKAMRINKVGRKYTDYQAYVASHPKCHIVQMDIVEGKKGIGEKVILTFVIPDYELFLAFMLDSKSLSEVKRCLDYIEAQLGTELFNKIFEVILTDNGPEFNNYELLETGIDGKKRTQIFYCEPYSSFQKGSLENCHLLLRRIFKKHKSLNAYDDNDVRLAVNHINNYSRDALNGETPYKVASRAMGKCALKLLGLYKIDPNCVILKPELLAK